jgi:hypothetical protein
LIRKKKTVTQEKYEYHQMNCMYLYFVFYARIRCYLLRYEYIKKHCSMIRSLSKLCFFLFDSVRIWEFSLVWTDFDKFDNLSKRNIKLILKISSDLESLRGSSNKKTLYSTRSCVIWALFGTRGPLKLSFHSSFKLVHSCQREPKLHTNSLNK